MPETAATLSTRHQEALERFVLFWGEMASDWGRHQPYDGADPRLLYASGEPLDTDVIMARLHISRGNANMNLRSLMSYSDPQGAPARLAQGPLCR